MSQIKLLARAEEVITDGPKLLKVLSHRWGCQRRWGAALSHRLGSVVCAVAVYLPETVVPDKWGCGLPKAFSLALDTASRRTLQ